jgi:hypothetical protein
MPLTDAGETFTTRYFVMDERCREALHVRHPIRTDARDVAAPAPSCASTPSVTAQSVSACATCRLTLAGVGDQKEALRYDISDTLHEDALPPCRSFQPRPDAQSSCAVSPLPPSATAMARYTRLTPLPPRALRGNRFRRGQRARPTWARCGQKRWGTFPECSRHRRTSSNGLVVRGGGAPRSEWAPPIGG